MLKINFCYIRVGGRAEVGGWVLFRRTETVMVIPFYNLSQNVSTTDLTIPAEPEHTTKA